MKRSILCLLCVVYTGVVNASETSWSGAGDGTTWTSASNWSNGVPGANDTATFPSSVTLTSSFDLPSGLILNIAASQTVILEGALTGSGSLTKTGTGTLELSGENTFTGDVTILDGRVVGHGTTAFGTGSSGTVKISANSPHCKLRLAGVTITKNLILHNVNDSAIGCRTFFACAPNTTNRVEGVVSVPGSYLRMNVEANSILTFTGGGSFGNDSAFLYREDGSEIRLEGSPYSIFYQYSTAFPSQVGYLVFSVPGNSVIDNSVASRLITGFLRTTVDNAWTPNSYFCQTRGTLDLQGTTQTLDRIFTKRDTVDGKITGIPGASLTFTSPKAYTNDCAFTGSVSLRLEGASDNYVSLGGESTTTGTLTIATNKKAKITHSWNGPWVLEEGAHVRHAQLGQQATLPRLSLASTAQLELPSDTLYVHELLINGVAQSEGTYTASTLSQLTGAGTICVTPIQSEISSSPVFTWVGRGASPQFNQFGNWENEAGELALPDWTQGNATLILKTVPTELFISEPLAIHALQFSAESTCTLTPQNGATLLINQGTVTVSNALSQASHLDMRVPLHFAGNATLEVAPASTLSISEWHTRGPANLVKRGQGQFNLSGEANRFFGDIQIEQGRVELSGQDPLGGTGTFEMMPTTGNADYLYLSNAVLTRDVVHHNQNREIKICISTTNEIRGQLRGTQMIRLYAYQNSFTRLTGGVRVPGTLCVFNCAGKGARLLFEDTPILSSDIFQFYNDADLPNSEICFNVPGSTANIYLCQTLRAGCDDAFLNSNLKMGKSHARLNLDGHTIHVQNVYREKPLNTDAQGLITELGPREVCGGEGSHVLFNGQDAIDFGPLFTEAASFTQAGTGTVRLWEQSTSTGRLEVANGKVILGVGSQFSYKGVPQTLLTPGSWAGTDVQVTGGTLSIEHKDAFPKEAEFNVSGTGHIEIPAGVTVRIAHLFVDGATMPIRAYTSATLPCLTGGGTLHVTGLHNGTLIILR